MCCSCANKVRLQSPLVRYRRCGYCHGYPSIDPIRCHQLKTMASRGVQGLIKKWWAATDGITEGPLGKMARKKYVGHQLYHSIVFEFTHSVCPPRHCCVLVYIYEFYDRPNFSWIRKYRRYHLISSGRLILFRFWVSLCDPYPDYLHFAFSVAWYQFFFVSRGKWVKVTSKGNAVLMGSMP